MNIKQLVERLINALERVHTLAALTMLLTWEILHFYAFLFRYH